MNLPISLDVLTNVIQTLAALAAGAWAIQKMIHAAYPLRTHDLDTYKEER